VVHWYLGVDAPVEAVTTARSYAHKIWEAPDTVTTTFEYPKQTMVTYVGTYVSRIDDGGLEFRGDRGTLKIDRERLAVYSEQARYAAGTLSPEPEILVRSSGDGTVTHLANWLDCIRSRKQPNAHIRVGHHAARAGHIANAALRAGKRVRFDTRAEKVTD
jgi:predicted dehydrogenase